MTIEHLKQIIIPILRNYNVIRAGLFGSERRAQVDIYCLNSFRYQ